MFLTNKVSAFIKDAEVDTLVDTIYQLTELMLDKQQIRHRVVNAQRIIEMREDPDHEAWMEQR